MVSTIADAPNAAAAPTSPRRPVWVPATNSITKTMEASTMVVPRFGSIRTRPPTTASTPITGQNVRVGSCISRERAGEQVGDEQQERELGELRRLDLERSGAEPAGGAVHLHTEARHQHQQRA